MNETPLNRTLPARCEVLVIGAGPAGSACAQMLARAGRDVLLVDRQVFPRDKVCGDGLIPDAHRALTHLGVYDQVMARARTADAVRCVGPRGGRIDVPGRLAVLPRRELDAILLQAAQAAGARMAAPWRLDAPLPEGGRIAGARLACAEATAEVRADWTVLATGGAAQPLQQMGVCARQAPSAIALRGHVRHTAMDADWRTLDVIWHRELAGGYGWIFPGPGGVFNIGVGAAGTGLANLRSLLERFAAVYEPAGRLVREGQWVAPAKGAPLRWSLTGARPARAGLLVIGEAVGSTYAFTGEGIGKAMETGMLAAEALAAGDDTAVQRAYETALQAIKPRFDLYERAQRINRYPWLVDLLIWRANHTPRLRQRMAGVLEETAHLGDPLSPRGLMRLMWPR